MLIRPTLAVMDINQQFNWAMATIGQHVANGAGLTRLALAYSGGLDSAVLLHLLHDYAAQHPVSLTVFHVHHGLSPHAQDWVEHCRQQCALLSVPFEVAYVQLGATAGEGVEATARKKRYAALGALCTQYQIDALLTAHHQDDQAETMLLQLLRGSGVAGLCGMQSCHHAAELLNNDHLWLARPLLDCLRSDLEQFAASRQISHIDDESNADPRYARNALRLKIMPLLAEYFPGYQTRFARTAQHAQTSLHLIEHLAQQDYEHCLSAVEPATLNAADLAQLPATRIDNVLRYWIAASGRQMPSTARLTDMRRQLLSARDDARVCVKHGDMEVHRYRGQLSIASCFDVGVAMQSFVWQGETVMAFPGYGGVLLFEQTQPGQFGIARQWLLGRTLQMRLRRGGERLKLAANRPTRELKSHYQTLGIAYWERERLPFVWADTELLFAAGVGIHGPFLQSEEPGIVLRWQAGEPLNGRNS